MFLSQISFPDEFRRTQIIVNARYLLICYVSAISVLVATNKCYYPPGFDIGACAFISFHTHVGKVNYPEQFIKVFQGFLQWSVEPHSGATVKRSRILRREEPLLSERKRVQRFSLKIRERRKRSSKARLTIAKSCVQRQQQKWGLPAWTAPTLFLAG